MALFSSVAPRRWAEVSCLLAGCTLSGCSGGGGAGGAGGGVVIPLDGIWDTTDVLTERIQFTTPKSIHLLASKFDVTASVTTATDVCGGGIGAGGVPVDVEGTIDDGHVSLHPVGAATTAACVDGEFTNLRTLKVAASGGRPQRLYLNSRVDVGLSVGLWVSQGDGRLKLKFEGPESIDNDQVATISGCDVSSGTAGAIFSGNMTGYNTGSGANPAASELRDPTNLLVFKQLVFVDGATMTLQSAQGQHYTLQRQADSAGTTCT